jgi:small subunit ribosomal protein S16
MARGGKIGGFSSPNKASARVAPGKANARPGDEAWTARLGLANRAKLRHNNGLSYPRHRDQERKQSSVLMIRLSRTGARKQPYYRVVVIEKERARNGRPVEIVGTYNPRTNPASIDLKRERIEYWVSKGAQLSDRVSKIMSRPVPEAASTAA